LITIDDIWDIPTWNVIKCALVDSNLESRIIITTRIREVASKVGGVYNMKPLSDDNSKRLFYERIWGARDIRSDNPSADVCDKILRKCGGVPLSIITIASLLVGKRKEDWSKVYDSIGFGHEDNEAVKNTRKILSFSYYDLPSYLKTCLLHLSIFPEDHLINKTELIWMWIGEGFVPFEQGLRLFELGERYFNHLVNRSMIRFIESGESYSEDACRVHDMVLDLIRNLSSELNFVKVLDIEPEPNTCLPSRSISIRRLALHQRRAEHNLISMEMGHLRSFRATLCSDSRLLQLSNFKVLRVLALDNCDFPWGACNLEHLGKLVQLRYLGLVKTPIAGLPAEIGHDLKLLQTLDVRGSGIEELPSSVAEMSKLMCLRADDRTRMMARIGKLTSLEELELSSVDKWPNFATEISNLTEVRLLEIHFDEMDESVSKALVESLGNLRRTQVLTVKSDNDDYYDDGAWEDWTPPLEIRELSLYCIHLPNRPSWMDSSNFPYLSFLNFEVVMAKEDDLHILGRLPELRYLRFFADYACLTYTVGADEFCKLRKLITTLDVIFGAEGGALPMLEELVCTISVGNQGVCGLVPGNMPLLKKVDYWLDCRGCSSEEVEEAEIALRHAATQVHPNRPAIFIQRPYEVSTADDQEVSIFLIKYHVMPQIYVH
jgi:Leucine-rich repeat (LRR) protein